MEQTRRDSFRSRWGFKLACIGSAVGMGNIWLFPSRMSAYGGATFLIPYVPRKLSPFHSPPCSRLTTWADKLM